MTNYDFYKLITSLLGDWDVSVLTLHGIATPERAIRLVATTTVRPNREELEKVRDIIHVRQTELALMNADILVALGEMK